MVLVAFSGMTEDTEIINMRVARAIARGRGNEDDCFDERDDLHDMLREYLKREDRMVPYFASDDPDGMARYVQHELGILSTPSRGRSTHLTAASCRRRWSTF